MKIRYYRDGKNRLLILFAFGFEFSFMVERL